MSHWLSTMLMWQRWRKRERKRKTKRNRETSFRPVAFVEAKHFLDTPFAVSIAKLSTTRKSSDERTASLPRSLAQQLLRISAGGSSADSGTAGGGRDQARTCRTWTDGHYGPRRSRQMAAIRGGPLGSHFGLFAAAARRGGFLCMESGYNVCLCTLGGGCDHDSRIAIHEAWLMEIMTETRKLRRLRKRQAAAAAAPGRPPCLAARCRIGVGGTCVLRLAPARLRARARLRVLAR